VSVKFRVSRTTPDFVPADSPKRDGTKVLYTAFGSAGSNAFDYVIRRFIAFSAGLKGSWG